jgi:hypothetical protein
LVRWGDSGFFNTVHVFAARQDEHARMCTDGIAPREVIPVARWDRPWDLFSAGTDGDGDDPWITWRGTLYAMQQDQK